MEPPCSFSSCMVPACLTELAGLGRRQVRASGVYCGAQVRSLSSPSPSSLSLWELGGGDADAWKVGNTPSAGDGGTSGHALWISCAEICLGLEREMRMVMLTTLAPVQNLSSLVASLLSMFPRPVSTWLLGWLRGVLENCLATCLSSAPWLVRATQEDKASIFFWTRTLNKLARSFGKMRGLMVGEALGLVPNIKEKRNRREGGGQK